MDKLWQQFHDVCATHFRFEERGTNMDKEIRGGFATFLTMSYILVVNPQVLSQVGLSSEQVVVATALSSFVGCVVSGVFSNLPLGLAPGIGLSAYLTYGLVLDGMALHEALTACMLSGLLLCALALTGVAELVMSLVPRAVKTATVVGMGLQVALVGLSSVRIVVASPLTMLALGPMDTKEPWLAFLGLILITTLLIKKVRGSILIGILCVTVLQWCFSASSTSSLSLAHLLVPPAPALALWPAQVLSALSSPLKLFPAVLAFLFVGLVDVGGVVFGMARLAGITGENGANGETDKHSANDKLEDGAGKATGEINSGNNNENNQKNAKSAGEEDEIDDKASDSSSSTSSSTTSFSTSTPVPGQTMVFVGCGLGSVVGACLGSAPVIVYVESAAGVGEGARAGLSGCVCGALFLLCAGLGGLLARLPACASAPVAVLVGALMMAESARVRWRDLREAVPAFLTLALMPLSFSITNGILAGLISAFALYVATGDFARDAFALYNSHLRHLAARHATESQKLFDKNIVTYGLDEYHENHNLI